MESIPAMSSSLRWSIAITMISLLLTGLSAVWSLCLGMGLTDTKWEKMMGWLIALPWLACLALWIATLVHWGKWLIGRVTG
jgi:hypothetical protein